MPFLRICIEGQSMVGYWAEIKEDKIVIYNEKYLAEQRQTLLQQLMKMRESYRRYQRRVMLSSKKKEILEMSGVKVLKDAFLALEGRWHWFTGYNRRDAFRLAPKAERIVSINGFFEIKIDQEEMTEKETKVAIELSPRVLKEAYDRALSLDRVVEDYTRKLGIMFTQRGYLEPIEVFYFICWKPPAGARIPNTWLFELINNRERVKAITQEALKLAAEDKVKEAIEKLIMLPRGVGVRVASAILTFYDPDKFGVIDRFAWKALYGMYKDDFTPEDYVKYLTDIRKMAVKYHMRTREVDLALWELGKRS